MDGDAIDAVVDETLEQVSLQAERARRDHAIATMTPGERFDPGIQELKE